MIQQLLHTLESLKGVLAGLLIAGSVAAPMTVNLGAIVGAGGEVELKWRNSYETLAFDTADGDLGMDEYAIADEDEWYIRTVPKDEGQFEETSDPKDIVGKKEVKIKCYGCAYYSEFYTPKGARYREPIPTAKDYKDLSHVPNHPQPTKRLPRGLINTLEADAAIAFDTATIDTHCSNCSSNTWSHVSTGSNLILLISPNCADNDSGSWNGTDVTYNSVALTRIDRLGQDGANNDYLELWYQVNPTTGSNTASISDSAAFSCDQLKGISLTYTGVDQTTPINATSTNRSTGSTDPSTNVTTTVANTWVVDVVAANAVFTGLTVNASQNGRVDNEWGNGNRTGASDKVAATAGGYTMQWDLATNSHWIQMLAAINEAAAAAGAATTTPQVFIKNGKIIIQGGKIIIKKQ